jgi:hypothetical protein
MKCFTAQQSPYCCVGIERWTADPETIPGSPIADPKHRLKRGVTSPPQSG